MILQNLDFHCCSKVIRLQSNTEQQIIPKHKRNTNIQDPTRFLDRGRELSLNLSNSLWWRLTAQTHSNAAPTPGRADSKGKTSETDATGTTGLTAMVTGGLGLDIAGLLAVDSDGAAIWRTGSGQRPQATWPAGPKTYCPSKIFLILNISPPVSSTVNGDLTINKAKSKNSGQSRQDKI